jgi:hypothetical protein
MTQGEKESRAERNITLVAVVRAIASIVLNW